MTRVYYKEAVGAFLVFDVNKPQTFNGVLKWKHDLDTKICLADGFPIPCLLLANKVRKILFFFCHRKNKKNIKYFFSLIN